VEGPGLLGLSNWTRDWVGDIFSSLADTGSLGLWSTFKVNVRQEGFVIREPADPLCLFSLGAEEMEVPSQDRQMEAARGRLGPAAGMPPVVPGKT
jgi:hypothetical protein